MKPSEVLYELRELNQAWRKQDFTFTREQKARYDTLITLRRERVKYFYANNMVCKVSKSAMDKLKEED